ncbi:MAG: tRNA (adenosine(37)-N6)-threonylcarbamoyltransferase complex ATPase subunit type 1 TsaE [Hydrogenoanaerobacterium sp.]
MLSCHTKSAAETEAFAKKLTALLRPNDVLAFRGSMGMGKTTFVRGLAEGLGGAEVSSPTFAIVHEYKCTPKLYHFDMYRITSIDDLYSTGFFDYLEMGAIMAIEWSELIDCVLPANTTTVTITGCEEADERDIAVEGDSRFTQKNFEQGGDCTN